VSDQLLVVLRVCLLALVYLVFLRVLRAVWVELRVEQGPALPTPVPARARRPDRRAAPPPAPAEATPAAAAPAATHAPSGPARLVVVAPPDRAGRSYTLAGEVTIGRAAGCAVAIDDAHVSKLHARVYPHDGSWLLEDLGSTNGTALDGRPVAGPTPLRAGSRVEIGDNVLEFR
jgi:pSer/pThr/pTyr-binding forkhead associated (FHA) protein